MINLDELKLITSQELLEQLYGKNLETKKDVLEYIERTKILKGEGVPQEYSKVFSRKASERKERK